MRVLIVFCRSSLLACLLLCFAWSEVTAAASRGSGEKLKSYRLYGGEYVSLHQWARIKGFSLSWDKQNKIVHLKNKWAKISIEVNSRRATIDGITIWLCSALAEYRNALYISERDVHKTLHPVLYPSALSKGDKVRTIVIAPGHGGKDPGNIVNKSQEKKYTLLMSKALKEALQASGFKVLMTRETDKFVDLEPQAAFARKAKADLFLSVHYNAVADVDPKGVETFSLTPAGAISTNGGNPRPWARGNKTDSFNFLLAYHVQKSILENSDFEDRGVRRAAFLVLREIDMPGILIEGGFMSNRSDAQKIFSAAHRKKMARAIADGVVTYKKLVERK